MTIGDLINAAQMVANKVKYYTHCGTLQPDGGCDCIGLIKTAYEWAGGHWSATAGSNAAARYMVQELLDIGQMAEGMVVFKYHPPDESGYDLPDTYRGHPDQNDYYHIGIVMTLKPLQILHCTTVQGGIKIDNSIGQWRKCAYLKGVVNDMTGNVKPWGTEVDYAREVWAQNGAPVNLRMGPGKSYKAVTQVKVGTLVEVRWEINDTWAYIKAGANEGYIMREYLRVPETAQPLSAGPIAEDVQMEAQYSEALPQTVPQDGNVVQLLEEILSEVKRIADTLDVSLHG